VDADLCTGCGTCEKRCPFHAISLEETSPEESCARVDHQVCFGCGVCAVTCPTGALQMKLVRPASHITGPITG